ncbi:UNKNOWN [Stylonychia lemnae]|uniref:Uncharacterized protein n=1 Tax=Stylonychia lemnae TaxID=5949 RepID=A0A078B8H7_STYLE|nr:UNKNOWN [Stylonychia lemnae]|eukprot:CDW90820.1 UNKNOWN [Stylonychia lemnae]
MESVQNLRATRHNNDLIQHIELKPVLTKKDIRDVLFQKQDQQHWQKIVNAKPAIETEVHLFIPKKSVRQKKTLLLDEGLKAMREDHRIKVVQILERDGMIIKEFKMKIRLMNQKSHFDWEKVEKQNQKHDELVSINDNTSILNSIENKTQSLASIQNEPKPTRGFKNLMIQNDEIDILGSKEMTQDFSEIIHKNYVNDELPEQFKAQLSQLRSKSNLGRKVSPMKQLELLIRSKNNNRYENAKSRKILYQNYRYINGKQYEIEMSKTKHKLVIICMNQENKKSQIIQLFLKQAQRIVELATQNMKTKLVGYQKILKFLDNKHGKILLDVPKDLQFYDEQ